MSKVYKFATGEPIPKGATYLNTVTQTEIIGGYNSDSNPWWKKCWLVWHYWLVEE